MKRTLIFVATVIAALYAGATERFYIEGFTLAPGETQQVSILLENDVAYTAFQCDMYLPEGMTVEQEDGDYIFDLTNRKGRDHNIASQTQVDGAIRIMSYSPSIKAYSDNSGALVTFNVTASADFNGGTIELKNTLFTDMNDQEISFANESCQVQAPLKDLSGEILIIEENGGGETNLIVRYTGEEDVDFSIYLNGGYEGNDQYDLLQDYSDCIEWDNLNKLYIIDLHKLEGLPYTVFYSFGYTVYYEFEVIVHADGYRDLLNTYSTSYTHYYTVAEGPNISQRGMSDLAFYYGISYENSVHESNCPGYRINDEWDNPIYAVERLDHDYYITVTAGQKDPSFVVFTYSTETFLIPARECEVSISKSTNNIIGRDYLIFSNDGYYDGELFIHDYIFSGEATDRLGASFAIIEGKDFNNCEPFNVADSEYYESFIVTERTSINVDGRLVYDDGLLQLRYCAIIFNLLPYGDIYGGDHLIEATVTDGYYSLSSDTVLTVHPIEARLTADALILDVASDMNNLVLRVDGQEVELSTNGQAYFYALERLDHDYTVTAQVGVEEQKGWQYYSFWSEETTIVVPAKATGDVNGDGFVNVADVTTLISKILGNEVSPFYEDAADLTGDGLLNVADVTALISIVLNN